MNNKQIIGIIFLFFGGIIFLSSFKVIISLIIAFVGIMLVNYGLDFLGYEIEILSDLQANILKILNFKIKTKSNKH